MNYPNALFAVLCLVILTACPPDTRPSDPDPGPADGGTGGAACEDEQAKIKALEAELEILKGGEPK